MAAAWRQITEINPFPAVCGRLCQHPCEAGCNRKAKDGAVGINLMERAIGDYGVSHGLQLPAVSGFAPPKRWPLSVVDRRAWPVPAIWPAGAIGSAV